MVLIRFTLLIGIGILLGAGSMYVALKLGFAVGVSLLTVIFVKGFDTICSRFFTSWGTVTQQDHGYFLSLTTGMSYATVTLVSTVLAALYLSNQFPTNTTSLVLWVISLNLIGTLLAWIFREYMSSAPFPSATAAASLVKNTERDSSQQTFWVTFGGTWIWIALRDMIQWIPGTVAGFSTSPLFIGLGGLLGFKTCLSFFLGGLFFFLPEKHMLGGEDEMAWFAVSALMTYIVLDFLAPLLKGRWSTSRIHSVEKTTVGLLAAALFFSLLVFSFNFPIGVISLILVCLLLYPWSLFSSRITGETDVTPIGALGKLAIFIFWLFPHSGSIMPWIGQLIGPAAASADFSSDLKCGTLLECSPRKQLYYQAIGSVVGPIVMIPVFLSFLPLIGTDQFPVPAARIWNQFLEIVNSGMLFSSSALRMNFILGLGVGIGYWALRKWVWKILPSIVPFCMAFFLDLPTTNTLLIGGLLSLALVNKLSEEKLLLNWSGLMAGEGILMAILLLFY